jgi:hypothetical protein
METRNPIVSPPPNLSIENKYYNAQLKLFFNSSVADIEEGVIIVTDVSEVILILPV